MTVEMIISLIALATALFAVVRTFFTAEKTMNKLSIEVQPKEKKEETSDNIIKKTLQSIENYRK